MVGRDSYARSKGGRARARERAQNGHPLEISPKICEKHRVFNDPKKRNMCGNMSGQGGQGGQEGQCAFFSDFCRAVTKGRKMQSVFVA